MVKRQTEYPVGENTTRRNIEIPLIIANLALVAGTVILLWIAMYFYQRQIKAEIVSDNRFLTTEWQLLQELKTQTDRQLREKDLEITELRVLYRKLSLQNNAQEQLLELENHLKRAEAERESLFAMRLTAIADSARETTPAKAVTSDRISQSGSTVAEAYDSSVTAENAQALNGLLTRRIQELEILLAQSRTRAEVAESRMMGSPAVSLRSNPTEAESRAKMDEILLELQRKMRDIDAEPAPKIEDIKTRSLLRAIVSSAPIRNEYPDLLNALDRYLKAYARQEMLNGQKEAYTTAIETVKAVNSGTSDGE